MAMARSAERGAMDTGGADGEPQWGKGGPRGKGAPKEANIEVIAAAPELHIAIVSPQELGLKVAAIQQFPPYSAEPLSQFRAAGTR
eukprot:7184820-Pyramimonas_sp.AAC.1